MAEPFIAGVQYGDLKGTIAFDGFESPPLHQLAKLSNMPPGYFPVGFTTSGVQAAKSGVISFDIVAVRSDDVSGTVDDMIRYARENNELPVYRFSGELEVDKLPSLFKRMSMKVVLGSLAGENIVDHGEP